MLLAVAAGLLMLSLVPVSAQSQLPPCPTDRNARWDMCVGDFTDPDDGERYVGEWRNNQRNGQGASIFPGGNGFVGQYRDDRLYQGAFTWANGDRYVGEFSNDQRNGQGTFTWANGDRYVGEFSNDQLNGHGDHRLSNGGRYFGGFRGGAYHGVGRYMHPDGEFYFGEWQNGQANGQGLLVSASGRLLRNGIWRNDEFIRANTLPPPALVAQGSQASTPAPPAAQATSGTRVRLVREAGTFKVPVRINGVLELQFTVDTGASDVTIPADVVRTLVRTGTISESDFIGEQTYRLADGSTIRSATFRIRQLQVGERTVTNVLGSVANVDGSLLLGQSFLRRFQRVSFDYGQGVLVLE
jgi:clan AA aspartic protease (TIGR02281 family)